MLNSYKDLKVIPVNPNNKVPLIGDWGNKGSNDPEQLKKWMRQFPKCNIGVLTGKVNNIEVLDVDPRNGGITSLMRFLLMSGELPTSNIVETGSGGLHFYFNYTGIKPFISHRFPGLDWQSDKKYIIAPPSIHPYTKKPYRWINFDHNHFMRTGEYYV